MVGEDEVELVDDGVIEETIFGFNLSVKKCLLEIKRNKLEMVEIYKKYLLVGWTARFI